MKFAVRTKRNPDGTYLATSPLLPGCSSCGKTPREAVERYEDAARIQIASVTNFVLSHVPLAVVGS